MKKMFSIILLILLALTSIVFAEEATGSEGETEVDMENIYTWDLKCDEAHDDTTRQGCWDTMKYCFQDGQERNYTGCFFDKNNPEYATTMVSGVDKPKYSDNNRLVPNTADPNAPAYYITEDEWKDQLIYDGGPNDAYLIYAGMSFRIYNNIPYQRAYAAVADKKDSQVTTAACYAGYVHVRKNHKAGYVFNKKPLEYSAGSEACRLSDNCQAILDEGIGFDITPEKCDPNTDSDCMGGALIFKLFIPSSDGVCTASMARLILGPKISTVDCTKNGNILSTSVAKNDNLKNPLAFDDSYGGSNYHLNKYLFNKDNKITRGTANIVCSSDKKCTHVKENGKAAHDECSVVPGDYAAYVGVVNAGKYRSSYYFRTLGISSMIGVNESAMYIADDADPKCPEFFYVNPNLGPKEDLTNKYKMSNKQGDASNYDMDFGSNINNFFTGNYENGTSYQGCTTEDTKEFEKMKECFEKAEKSILKSSCPEDITNFDKFTKDLDKYQDKCKADYKDAYAIFLMKEENDTFDPMLKEAKNKKIDNCYYKYCKFTDKEIKALEEELNKGENTNCKDGCRITSKYEFSDSPDAKCWLCGVGNGSYYTWTEGGGTTCHPESRSREKCYGTIKEQECIGCIENVYKKLNIHEDKIKCINDLLGIREQIKNDTDDVVDQQSQDYTDEAALENARNASDTHAHYYKYGSPDGDGFGPEDQECVEIAGVSGTKIIKSSFNILRIAGAIIAIVNAMIALIPAVTSKNADALKKAANKCVIMAIVLAAIGIFPSIVRLIASLFGYDISCLI